MCAHHGMLDGMLEHLSWLLSKTHFSGCMINVQLNTALIKYNYFVYKYLYRCFCNIAHECFFNSRNFLSLGLIFITRPDKKKKKKNCLHEDHIYTVLETFYFY